MKSKAPLVSIVIPTYNAADFIVPAVESALKTLYPNFEVVIVDDLSTDNTLELIKQNFSKVRRLRVYKNKEKLLAAGSRNRGAKLAKGKYIALLDHDVEVDKNWIKEAIKVFNKDTKIGTVQGVVLDLRRRNIIQHAGIQINSYLGWVISLGFGKDLRRYKLEEKIVFANATGLIFKKSAWKKVGGYDEDLAINVDDWDFNWRIWLYGYKQVLCPKSITYHWSKTQKTRDKWIKRLSWEFHFAKVSWIFIKNYELKNIFYFLPIYLSVNLFRGLFNLIFRLNPVPLGAFFKANYWVASHFSILLKKRNITQLNRKVSDRFLLENIMDNSFVLNYFLKSWLPVVKLGSEMSTKTYEKK